MNDQIKVKKYLSEKNDNLFKIVDRIIKDKSKLHISAPVGTGKTTFVIDLIKKYNDHYQFLLLEPQISISSQVENKMKSKNLKSFVFNSNTRAMAVLKARSNKKSNTTYLSTIDSAWRLFEDGYLDPDKTVVIVDESHSFLQNTRAGFDKTARTIRDSGYPLIGFTATTSKWVLDYVFNMDEHIEIEATDLPKKKVIPFQITGIPSTIAQVIKEDELEKVVIFTENKTDQKKISESIKLLMPKKKVVYLNADNRESSEKSSWKHLMDNDELPKSVNVAIINSVAQAGININDKDIDQVFLVGKFDPLGFQQYLGRCRNYSDEYYYLHLDFGDKEVDWENPNATESAIDSIQKDLHKYNNKITRKLLKIDPSLNDLYSEDPEEGGGYILNRCMAAHRVYKQFREVHPAVLIEFLKSVAPNIEFDDYHTFSNITTSSASAKKAVFRKTKKALMPGLARRDAVYLNEMIPFLEGDWKHETALKVIEKSTTDKTKSKNEDELYIPRTRKSGVIKTIKTSEQAGESSLVRVLLAAKYYLEKGKDVKVLNKILGMSIPKIEKHLEAFAFFEKNYGREPLIKSIVKKIEDDQGMSNTVGEWLNIISKHINLYGADTLARTIFNCCLITEIKKVTIDSSRKSRHQLKQVVYNFSDYSKAHKLDELFK